MSEQPHIDDFFRQKLSQREIPYQEKYWADAERLIEAQQKKKRRGLIWFAFSNLGLGLALLPFTVMALMGGFSEAETPVTGNEPLAPTYLAESLEEECPPEENGLSSTASRPDGHGGTGIIESATRPAGLTARAGSSPFSIGGEAEEIVNDPATGFEPGAVSGEAEAVNRRLQSSQKDRKPFRIDPVKLRQFIRSVSPQAQMNHRFPHNGLQAFTRHYLGLQLSGAMFQGWQNRLDAPGGLSMRPLVSAYYAYGLSPRLRFRTGLGYVSRGALNSDSTYRSVSFSFGRIEENTTIAPLSMHGVEVPLLLDLHMGKRHYLTLGLQSQYWLNTRAEVTDQRVGNFETPAAEGQKAWGYRQGLSRWDVSGQLGYGYYLGRGYMLRVSALYGIKDQTLDAFFQNTTKDRNLQLRIGIAKDLYHW